MENSPITSKQYFLSLKIIFFALLAGQVMFALVAYFIAKEMEMNVFEGDSWKTLMFIMPLVILAGYFIGNFLYKRNLKTAMSRQSLAEKLNDYRAASVVRYALMEGTTFMSLVLYLLSVKIVFIGFGVIGILSFFTMIPSAEKAVTDLELDPNEEQIVRDPEAVISELKLNK